MTNEQLAKRLEELAARFEMGERFIDDEIEVMREAAERLRGVHEPETPK